MGMTEQQLEEIAVCEMRTLGYTGGFDEGFQLIKRFLAALPKPKPLFWYRPCCDGEMYEGPIHNAAIEDVRKNSGAWKPLYTEAPIAQPASVPTGWDAEFLAKRLGRVAKLAGVSMPENFTHEQVAEAAGTILGQIAAAMEAKPASAPSEQKPYCWDVRGDAGNHLCTCYDELTSEFWKLHGKTVKPLFDAPQPDYKAQRDTLLELVIAVRDDAIAGEGLLCNQSLVDLDAAIASVKGGE